MNQSTNQRLPVFAYWQDSQRPIQSLFFLLPLILFYEAWLMYYGTDQIGGVAYDVYARRLLDDLFEWFGISSYYLPGLIVVVALLSLHVVRRDPWRFEPRVYGCMGIESLALALPLLVFGLVVPLAARVDLCGAVPVWTATSGPPAEGGQVSWMGQLVFSIGAGIYEELLFRLIALALLHAIFADLLRWSNRSSALVSIGLSAMGFAAYHFSAQNPFVLGKFIFYALAGAYFSALYLLRGFGIVVGVHATYDVLVVLFQLFDKS